MSTEDHILELIPAYTLGCLDEDEIALVKQHLPQCAACRAEVAAYQAVSAQLPLAVPAARPPADLKQRLLESIQSQSPVTAPAIRSTWWRQLAALRWQPITLLLIIALLISNLLLWQRLRRVTETMSLFHSVTLSGTENAPEATGLIVVSPDGRTGTLVVERLPWLAEEQQYQLWLVYEGQRTSGAVFSVDQTGYNAVQVTAPRPIREYPTFGITIEPAGGSPGPTGTRVLRNTP